MGSAPFADSPIEEASKGAVKGALEHIEEKVAELIRRFRNKEISFLKNPEDVQLVRKEKNTGEWKLLSEFLPKGEIAVQVQMGLLLRSLDDQSGRQQSLRLTLLQRFGEKGLHIAELTQNRILAEFLVHLAQTGLSYAETQERFQSFLLLANDVAIFVQASTNVTSLVSVIKTRLETVGPSYRDNKRTEEGQNLGKANHRANCPRQQKICD